MTILRCHQICQSFRGKRILDNLDLHVEKHQRVVIMGKSGSGKSLLLRCILGLLQPDHGTVFWKNRALNAKRYQKFRSQLGVVFQNSVLFDHLTVWENIGLALQYVHRQPVGFIQSRVSEILDQVDLEKDVMSLFPYQLSGGMQRRVALARALITKPLFWICDEPTTGLDPALVESISHLMKNLTQNTTLLTVTHDIQYAQIVGTHFYQMHQGRLHEKDLS